MCDWKSLPVIKFLYELLNIEASVQPIIREFHNIALFVNKNPHLLVKQTRPLIPLFR